MKRLPTLIFLYVLILLQISTFSDAQDVEYYANAPNIPEVGKPMPDFNLAELKYFKATHASLSDFKNKWLILDFWVSYCLPCVASFPKISSLQSAFRDEIQFLMIGCVGKTADNLHATQLMYEKLKQKQNLELAVAYDSILIKRWSIGSVPHLIIIDPQGIVRAITNGRDLTKEKLQEFLAGENPTLYNKSESPTQPFKSEELFLINGNGGMETDFEYRSLLAKYSDQGFNNSPVSIDRHLVPNTFQAIAAPLYWLYNYAYFGRPNWDLVGDSLYANVYPKPILELKDTTLFNFNFNKKFNNGLFNYSLSIPGLNLDRSRLMAWMQNDLKNYFGYSVSVEYRQMPCLKLVKMQDGVNLLKSKGGDGLYPSATAGGFELKNTPISMLLSIISDYHAGKPPLVDETGIDYKIDIKIDALMTDIREVRRALKKNGLDLVESRKKMKVIVIKD